MSATSLAESKTFLHSWVKRIDVDKEDGTCEIKWTMPTIPGAPWTLSRVLSMEKIGAPQCMIDRTFKTLVSWQNT